MRNLLLIVLLAAILAPASFAAVPPLPDGLQENDKKEEKKTTAPALPPGLFGEKSAPPLPPGLGTPVKTEDEKNKDQTEKLGLNLTGFGEIRAGVRLQADPHEKAASIGEARLQLSLETEFDFGTATLTGDLVFDPVLDNHAINLEAGKGWFDLREASFLVRPTSFADVKVGRQILTWGTGDLLFINDLFPKDWNAFFIGRDTEYLKAPSDAAKLALFSSAANLDVVYTPRFDADRFIDGNRLSYFNPSVGEIAGQNAVVRAFRPDGWFSSDEWALRLHRNIGTSEAALYFYDGFWKSPAGQSQETGLATFPRLRTYGASLRRPLFGGIAHLEAGYYDSLDDPNGDNPLITNSETRFLIGFERELAPELTGSFQYYQERILDYKNYSASLPVGTPQRDKVRHLLTARLTKLARNQTLIWSLFAYFSPSDKDGYLRPKVTYKLTDAWQMEFGANVFFGAERNTFFGQFQNNTNLFTSLRISY